MTTKEIAAARKQALEEAMGAIREARHMRRRELHNRDQNTYERGKGIDAALEAVQDLLDVDVRREV